MLDTSQLPLSTSQTIEFFSQLLPIHTHTYTSMNETSKQVKLTLITTSSRIYRLKYAWYVQTEETSISDLLIVVKTRKPTYHTPLFIIDMCNQPDTIPTLMQVTSDAISSFLDNVEQQTGSLKNSSATLASPINPTQHQVYKKSQSFVQQSWEKIFTVCSLYIYIQFKSGAWWMKLPI